ncbi:hypothetical protein LguiA_010210 [Lonicera macranthoides]
MTVLLGMTWKNKQYVRKGKGKATPIELASHVSDYSPYTPGYSPSQTQTEHQAEEEVPEAPVHDVGEGSSIASLLLKKMTAGRWTKEGTRKLYTSSRWPKFKSWDLSKEVDAVQIRVDGSCFSSEEGGKDIDGNTAINLVANSLGVTKEEHQAAVDAALSLVEGALFGGQSQDKSAIVNKVYDIFKVTRMRDNENSMGERRSKRLQDLSPTVSTPGRAKAPPRKKSKK